ncbi:MAG: hypothetical protein EZS28_014636 [Streblomastix strix]|uniref:Uncharacterized protein n=1 Tax=Streblomastix strix TaxID=222440 RepID=A0A5J4W4L9_9EUKA|nr:MAG: hypothetical protein EZS28_014636 [Streblomastix strix]
MTISLTLCKIFTAARLAEPLRATILSEADAELSLEIIILKNSLRIIQLKIKKVLDQSISPIRLWEAWFKDRDKDLIPTTCYLWNAFKIEYNQFARHANATAVDRLTHCSDVASTKKQYYDKNNNDQVRALIAEVKQESAGESESEIEARMELGLDLYTPDTVASPFNTENPINKGGAHLLWRRIAMERIIQIERRMDEIDIIKDQLGGKVDVSVLTFEEKLQRKNEMFMQWIVAPSKKKSSGQIIQQTNDPHSVTDRTALQQIANRRAAVMRGKSVPNKNRGLSNVNGWNYLDGKSGWKRNNTSGINAYTKQSPQLNQIVSDTNRGKLKSKRNVMDSLREDNRSLLQKSILTPRLSTGLQYLNDFGKTPEAQQCAILTSRYSTRRGEDEMTFFSQGTDRAKIKLPQGDDLIKAHGKTVSQSKNGSK